MGYRNYSVANGFTVDKLGNGDFITIASALTAAISGQTIFIRPGTYTENLTLKAGVNLTAFDCDAFTPNVIINGKCTFTGAGAVSISGINLQTNSDFALAVTGSAASIVYLTDCYLNGLNNTIISYTTSSSSASILVQNCYLNLATTGIAYFTCSTAGVLQFLNCANNNAGASATASTFASSGILILSNIPNWEGPITTSGTSGLNINQSRLNGNSFGTNTVALTHNSTGALCTIYYSELSGGSASALSIGAGATLLVDSIDVSSTNTNAITGAGTIKYGLIIYTGTSSTNNVSTQTAFTTQPASGSLVKLQTLTASASANISFTAGITATYNTYFVVINGMQPATNASQLLLTVSTNGGSSYLVTGYKALCNNLNNTGAGGAYATTSFILSEAADISNSSTLPFNASFYLYNLTNGTTPAISGSGTYNSTVAANTNNSLIGGFGPTTITVNAIQFIMSAGNITAGTFTLYGVTQ